MAGVQINSLITVEAVKEIDAIIRSIYRMKNKTKLLEWTVSEETDKKEYSFIDYFKEM